MSDKYNLPPLSDPGRIVTVDDIKELIERERLSPEQLFGKERMKEYVEAEIYVRREMEKPLDDDKGQDGEADANKYLDPARNPFIKTGG